MIIRKLILTQPTKENNFSKLDKTISNASGIYFLYDEGGLLLYIGKAKYLRQRILQHVSDGNSSRYKAGEDLSYGSTSIIPLGSVKSFSYIEIDDGEKRDVYEMILISILKPFFNGGDIERKTKEYERVGAQ